MRERILTFSCSRPPVLPLLLLIPPLSPPIPPLFLSDICRTARHMAALFEEYVMGWSREGSAIMKSHEGMKIQVESGEVRRREGRLC